MNLSMYGCIYSLLFFVFERNTFESILFLVPLLVCFVFVCLLFASGTEVFTHYSGDYDSWNDRSGELLTNMLLGKISALAIYKCILVPTAWSNLWFFILFLCIFHFMEYAFVCKFHFDKISFDSFLLNQSKEYVFCQCFSIFEFLFCKLIGFDVSSFYTIAFGLTCVVIGQTFRSFAEFTAGTNFTHLVSMNKKVEHVLITEGVYSISRHPSYFGFFIWSIGSQILLGNVVSCVVFTIVLWKFFADRIYFEEKYLIKFFGQSYVNYKANVKTLLPFIYGYDLEENNEEKNSLKTS